MHSFCVVEFHSFLTTKKEEFEGICKRIDIFYCLFLSHIQPSLVGVHSKKF